MEPKETQDLYSLLILIVIDYSFDSSRFSSFNSRRLDFSTQKKIPIQVINKAERHKNAGKVRILSEDEEAEASSPFDSEVGANEGMGVTVLLVGIGEGETVGFSVGVSEGALVGEVVGAEVGPSAGQDLRQKYLRGLQPTSFHSFQSSRKLTVKVKSEYKSGKIHDAVLPVGSIIPPRKLPSLLKEACIIGEAIKAAVDSRFHQFLGQCHGALISGNN